MAPALQGLDQMLAGLRENPPTAEEIDLAIRVEGVRLAMRRLSRINKTFHAAVEERRAGEGYASPGFALPGPAATDVARAIREWLKPEALARVILE
jgi:hypothetical protein